MAISASEDSPTNRDRIEMKGLLLSFRRLASVEGWRSKRIYRCPSSLRLQTCASPRSFKSQYRARSAATLYQQPRPDSIAIFCSYGMDEHRCYRSWVLIAMLQFCSPYYSTRGVIVLYLWLGATASKYSILASPSFRIHRC